MIIYQFKQFMMHGMKCVRKIHETRFKLLPQHIRDYAKPAPTNILSSISTNWLWLWTRSDQSQSPPLYELKDVREWNTVDCINWLGQIKESKVDLRVRYTCTTF